MNSALERVVGWLRESYPTGVPDQDYQPLFALLRRRLTPAEVDDVGHQLAAGGLLPADRVDVGVGITKVTQDLPSLVEIDRVMYHLEQCGVPIDQDWHTGS